jgi:type VI secretion system secreted protein Hcp
MAVSVNTFLKFEDPEIAGGSTAAGHQGEIEVLSWSHGFDQTANPGGSASGGTVEQARHASFTFTKHLDAATNSLLKFCWSSKQIGKATLSCLRVDAANQPVQYLTIVMEHVVIANYSISGASDIPVENVALDYGIIKYTYLGMKKADGMSATHNLENHTIS